MALKVGDKFLTDYECARIKKQSDWQDMLRGAYVHNVLIAESGGSFHREEVDPLIPVAGVISEIGADLLFGEFPEFEVGEGFNSDELLKSIGRSFRTDILEAATLVSAVGTLLCYVWKQNDKTYYKFLPVNSVTWETDELTGELVLVRMFKKTNETTAQIFYEVHDHQMEDGVYTIYKYTCEVRKNDNTVLKVEMLPDGDIKTDKTSMPFARIDNMRQLSGVIGRSDYQGKEQMFAEIDNRMDQINNVLTEHADPWIGLPPGVLDKNGKFNRKNGKMFEKSATGTSDEITVTQWDARLESGFEAIDKMIEMILFTTRISPALAGYTKGGYAESGRALKWRMVSTLSMIARKRVYWEEFFEDFFTIWSDISGKYAGTDFYNMTTKWKDGLPLDDADVIANTIAAVNAKLMSRLKGTQTVQEIDKDEARTEQGQISIEAQSDAAIEATRFGMEGQPATEQEDEEEAEEAEPLEE